MTGPHFRKSTIFYTVLHTILLCILDIIIIYDIMDNSPQIKQVKLSQSYKVDFHLELVSIFTPGMEKCFKPFPELIVIHKGPIPVVLLLSVQGGC